jgi:hypothetical protein
MIVNRKSRRGGLAPRSHRHPQQHRLSNDDAMQTATVELQKRGCVVHLATGYVGWPNKETAVKGEMTPPMIEWERIIREWS